MSAEYFSNTLEEAPARNDDASSELFGSLEQEGVFTTWDETELAYQAWLPRGAIKRGILLLHRGHEHSGRMSELASALGRSGTACFSYDARGHGRSPGPRGDAPSIAALIQDLDAFARFVRDKHNIPEQELAVVANSLSSVIASAWMLDCAPRIRSLVLVAPALRIKLYVPFAMPALRLLNKIRKRSTITSYVKGKLLTHDANQAQLYDSDSLIAKVISVPILLGLHDTATRVLKMAGEINVPVLVLQAGSDWIVKNSAQNKFVKALGSKIKRHKLYPNMYHGLLYEAQRAEPFEDIRAFIEQRFDSPALDETADNSPSARSVEAFQHVKKPLFDLSPKALMFSGTTLAMKTLGRWSDGIDLGWRSGFDSGVSLDYVYENLARGKNVLGRLIDRVYLNSPGWVGIRIRRNNIERLLGEVIDQVISDNDRAHILDIAAGGGRYVLGVVATKKSSNVTVLLRDCIASNLVKARETAEELGVEGVTYEESDAFNPDGVAIPPDIVVASGIYELFPDNELITRSLNSISECVSSGGYLIYTNQPWHPQQDFIARVLRNHRGELWAMRCRPQSEMDRLVRNAGFEKVTCYTDDAGIFTVSVARKRV